MAPDLHSMCLTTFVIQHEFLHAIGLHHEHQRPDTANWMEEDHAYFRFVHSLISLQNAGANLTADEIDQIQNYNINYKANVGIRFY